MVFRYFFILLFCALTGEMVAQHLVDNSFRFKEGVYTRFEEMKLDAPKYQLEELKGEWIVMEEQYRAKLVLPTDGIGNIDADEIWGISVAGVPYVKVGEDEEKGMLVFSGFRLRGKICYYEKEVTKEKESVIKAYNPVTGRPFRSAVIKNEKREIVGILLDFESGKTAFFELKTVRKWLSDDKQLSRTLEQTPSEELREKLFKFVRIYDDRNPVYIQGG